MRKRPKVRILIGKSRILIIGFKRISKMAKIKATLTIVQTFREKEKFAQI
jgi:hypothetical protein